MRIPISISLLNGIVVAVCSASYRDELVARIPSLSERIVEDSGHIAFAVESGDMANLTIQ